MRDDDPFRDGLPAIDGGHVRLRSVRPEDDADLLAVFGSAEHLRYWSHGPLDDLDAAREYREGIESGTRDREFFQWAVTEPDADQLIGTVTLGSWDRPNRRLEIGFILRPDRVGAGLASGAVRAAIGFASRTMGVHRIEADVDPENLGSIRLLERLGFQFEGRLRERWFTFGCWKDSSLYGLLTDEAEWL